MFANARYDNAFAQVCQANVRVWGGGICDGLDGLGRPASGGVMVNVEVSCETCTAPPKIHA